MGSHANTRKGTKTKGGMASAMDAGKTVRPKINIGQGGATKETREINVPARE